MALGPRQHTYTHNISAEGGRGGGGSPQPLLTILPTVQPSDIGAGVLMATNGTVASWTRTTSAYCTLANGTLSLLSANQPRVESLGLLVESSATNLALQSEDFTSATWVKTGVLATAPVVTGNTAVAPNGATTGDTITFPAVSLITNASYVGQPFAATAKKYTFSVWLKSPPGSGTNTIYLSMTDNAAIPTTYRGTTAVVVTEAAWTRAVAVGTLTAATWNLQLGCDLRDGGQSAIAGFAVYAWGAQVELDDRPSSYFPTTTTALTRGPDFGSIAIAGGSTDFSCATTATPSAGRTWSDSNNGGSYTLNLSNSLSGGGGRATANSWSMYMMDDVIQLAVIYDSTPAVKQYVTNPNFQFSGSGTHRIRQSLIGGVFTLDCDSANKPVSASGGGTGLLTAPVRLLRFGDGGLTFQGTYYSNIQVGVTKGQVTP